MRKRIILCFVGLPGSGKTKAKEMVLKNFDSFGISSGDIIREEIKRRGLQYSPHTDAIVAQWFHSQGRERFVVERLWNKIRKTRKKLMVIEGLRNSLEIEYLEKLSGNNPIIIAIVAPFWVRAKRELKRGRFEKGENVEYLRQRDRAEIGRGELKLIKKADYKINNARMSLSQMEKRIVIVVGKIMKNDPKTKI